VPISIKNEQTEELTRKLAKLTGETLTEAIRSAVAEKYERIAYARTGRTLADDLNAIALHCASLPVISNMTDDEILGYDEIGAPTR
jgi:antitoxin VapB